MPLTTLAPPLYGGAEVFCFVVWLMDYPDRPSVRRPIRPSDTSDSGGLKAPLSNLSFFIWNYCLK